MEARFGIEHNITAGFADHHAEKGDNHAEQQAFGKTEYPAEERVELLQMPVPNQLFESRVGKTNSNQGNNEDDCHGQHLIPRRFDWNRWCNKATESGCADPTNEIAGHGHYLRNHPFPDASQRQGHQYCQYD